MNETTEFMIRYTLGVLGLLGFLFIVTMVLIGGTIEFKGLL